MKFKVGEIAIFVSAPTHFAYADLIRPGDEVEIVRVGLPPGSRPSGPVPAYFGPRPQTDRHMDYEIRLQSGYVAPCQEHKLRKKRPPIPEEVLRVFNALPVKGERV